MSCKRLWVLVAAVLLVGARTASAQNAEKAVQDAVEAFLLHLGDHEYDKAAADLTPKSIVVIVRQRAAAASTQPEWSSSYQTGEEWVAALRRNPNPVTFREPITNVKVTIDSDRLAFLRADFQVMRDGAPQSHGVDEFTLVRESGGWKIAGIAYTSIPGR
jgi:SnoaL-like protein